MITQEKASRKLNFPTRTVMKVLAELEHLPMQEVEEFIKNSIPLDTVNKSKQAKVSKQYRLTATADITGIRGRARVVLDTLRELKHASIHLLVDQVQGKLKTKLNLERVVTYFINLYERQGIVEVIGSNNQGPSVTK
jgi:hypothetical protein